VTPSQADGPACENCGAALVGRFCHACGQSAEPPTTSVRAFVRHAAADLTSLDARILRTLGLLLARPGRLTREYLAGRRIRYTQPVQLYLGCAAAFFFVNAYHPFLAFDPRTGQVVSALGAAGVNGKLDAASRAALAAQGISLEVFRERFESSVAGYLPAFLVASVLLFGIALRIFFPRQKRGLVEHAVFALHWSAFYLLMMMVDRLLPQPGGAAEALNLVVPAVAAVYLGLAIRHVYAQSRLATALKTFALFILYQGLLSVWMATAIGFAFPALL
jgi:hypothetical protein